MIPLVAPVARELPDPNDGALKPIHLQTGSSFAEVGTTVETPRPLMREVPRAERFPVEALGALLGAAANAIHDRVQAPLAIGAQSVLAAAALAVQGHADVVLPIGSGQPKPISLYLMTLAASGERKTTCDSQALAPVRARESALRDRHDVDLPTYKNEFLAWEKARAAAGKKCNGDRHLIRTALDAIGSAPTPPLTPMLTCPEPTFEGLCRLQAGGQASLGLLSAEGGQFIGGYGMSDEAKLRTAAGLSAAWDGEPVRRVRASEAPLQLVGRRLSLHLMAQPDVAARLFRDPVLVDQGLLSRVLATAPESTAGTRLSREEQPGSDAALRAYSRHMLTMLYAPLPLAAGKINELVPRHLSMSTVATRCWQRFVDHVEREVGPEGALAAVRSLANKLPEHAARLAAVVTLVEDLSASEISAAQMEAGIALAEHYASEALRFWEASQVSVELRLAQRLLSWLQHRWEGPLISLPDIYQRGINAIGDQETARRVAGILEKHGWLTRVSGGAIVNGHNRRDVWRIVREG